MDAPRADDGDRAVEADEVEGLRQGLEDERQRNLRLLADFDNFRRRVGREKEAARRLFESALREAGAQPLEAVGKPFDPNLHEAVGAEPSDEAEPGMVVREVRRGWRLPDGLLRPAQVVVATGEEPARPWR